jgi:hypothetical protein
MIYLKLGTKFLEDINRAELCCGPIKPWFDYGYTYHQQYEQFLYLLDKTRRLSFPAPCAKHFMTRSPQACSEDHAISGKPLLHVPVTPLLRFLVTWAGTLTSRRYERV